MRIARQPRYQQIALQIAERIVRNELKVGQKIYARSTLATTFAVSPETARKAINVLSDLGIVDPVHGSGVNIASKGTGISGTISRSGNNARFTDTNHAECGESEKRISQFFIHLG